MNIGTQNAIQPLKLTILLITALPFFNHKSLPYVLSNKLTVKCQSSFNGKLFQI